MEETTMAKAMSNYWITSNHNHDRDQLQALRAERTEEQLQQDKIPQLKAEIEKFIDSLPGMFWRPTTSNNMCKVYGHVARTASVNWYGQPICTHCGKGITSPDQMRSAMAR
jgi:hypothetical protein